MEDDSVRKSALMNIASSVVEKHVDLAGEFCDQPQASDDGNGTLVDDDEQNSDRGDGGRIILRIQSGKEMGHT